MQVYNQNYGISYGKSVISGKKKDDQFTDDSSLYAQGDEHTNAVNINSNRNEFEFDGLGNISHED